MNVVDELVIRLGLDPKEFEKNSKVVIVQLEKVKDKAEESEKKPLTHRIGLLPSH